MKNEEIKSLQRKVINILTNVQTKTIGLEGAKEQLTNLFGVYEESDKINRLEKRLNLCRTFIKREGLSDGFKSWYRGDTISDSELEDIRMNDQSNTGQE
jgi:hypothetical protein